MLIDVLQDYSEEIQENIISRLCNTLPNGGRLIIREADAGAGWLFVVTKWLKQFRSLLRGNFSKHFHYRSRDAWKKLLEKHGMAVTVSPSSYGRRSSKVMFFAAKRVEN